MDALFAPTHPDVRLFGAWRLHAASVTFGPRDSVRRTTTVTVGGELRLQPGAMTSTSVEIRVIDPQAPRGKEAFTFAFTSYAVRGNGRAGAVLGTARVDGTSERALLTFELDGLVVDALGREHAIFTVEIPEALVQHRDAGFASLELDFVRVSAT